MFQKVFLLNPDMLPPSLLASGGGKRVGKKKKKSKNVKREKPASWVPKC